MAQREVTLPSGAKGRIRGLKGRELNLFANRSAARAGKTSQQILKNVWIETIDPGPLYSEEGVDWSSAPQCDRFTAIFYARIATYGNDLEFPYKCSSCGKKCTWCEDLSQRPIKMLPESSIEAFKAGNKLKGTVEDPDGGVRSFVFQLLTPKLEEKIEQVQSLAPTEKATASLAQRIVSIEGLEDGKGPVKAFLNDLDAVPLLDLMELMDAADGGINTTITVVCPSCGDEEDMELPLEEAFWAPPKRKPSTPPSRM